MKRRIAITTILLLVVCLVLSFAACKETLAAPTGLEMSGNVLTWQSVDGAEGYEVEISGLGKFETKNPMYFVEVENIGTYDIRVRAKKGEEYSAYSETYKYIVTQMLEKPVVSYDEITKVVSWDEVEGAESYLVRVRYTDKDISADGAIIEMSDVNGTSYTLDKEEYTKPGSFTIEVKAVAPENSESSDSAYSEAKVFVNTATLAAPVLSSITSTRVYWNSVSNASSYYLEARNKDNADEVYSTTVNATSSTSVSVLLSNFNIQTPGEYTVHIKTVGDGEVYQDSAITDVNDDFVIYKLAQLYEGCLVLEEQADGSVNAVWRVSDGQMIGVTAFTLVLTPYNSDGEALLSAQRVSFNLENESDMEKLTVTKDGEYNVYTFSVDSLFMPADGETEPPLNLAYYGKRYTAEISSSRSGNGVIAGSSVEAEEKYLSYVVPGKDTLDGKYVIYTAAELAYIAKQPDAQYKQLANIDFEGYEWLCVDSFGGTYDGGVYIISDMTVIGDGENVGFFGEIKSGATVSGLKLVNVSVESDAAKTAGIVAGVNNGTIYDCVAIGSVNAKYATAGGIAGINNGSVATSQTYADVTAALAGGIAGVNAQNAAISFSNARGDVTAKAEAAEDDSVVAVTESYAGGFVGANYGTIISGSYSGNVVSESTITLSKPNYAGGFVGYNGGTVSGSYAGSNYSNDYSKRNTVRAQGTANLAVGGFVGFNNGTINACYANVKASSSNYVGGFVGFNADGASITDSYSIGGVTVNTNNVGGFSGNTNGTIDNVYYYDETLGDSETRKDKTVSEYVAIENIGQTLATKLGDAFAVIGGDHPIRNAVLKNMIYNVTTSLEIGPGAKITAIVQYVDNDGTLNTVTAGNESETGITVCGDQQSEGTVIIVFSNGSYRGLVIVTVE